MSVNYQFKYMPLVGKLPGKSMAQQTETAINEIAEIVNENVAQAEIINTLAQDANNNSVEALEKANEALQTTGRVYVNVEGVVNLDNYCQSELLWIRNASSTNLPIQHSGFLEVKTNSDKTNAEQIFIDDSSGIVYSRAGTITAQQVGEVTNYVASYGEWVTIATNTYVTAELANYAPLASPAFTGNPTAPTQGTNNNSTRLATTEFVAEDLKNNALLVGNSFVPLLPVDTDLNNFTTAGTYRWDSSNPPTNRPTSDSNSNYCKLVVMVAPNVNYIYQLVFSHNGHIYKRRGYLGGGSWRWNDWNEFAYKEDVLPLTGGTMTGDIVISKSNNAGYCVKATNAERGVSPSSGIAIGGINFFDGNNVTFGSIQCYLESLRNSLLFRVQKNVSENDFRVLELNFYNNNNVVFRSRRDDDCMLGDAASRWKQLYAATTTISTSDERLKDNITAIPDEVLDAWGEVNWYQYQFKDSIEEKGETKARIHTGAIAQRIESIFESHGLDANRYGLLCYDEWKAESAQRDRDGNIVLPACSAGNRYSLRYEEALCMEAAYQRRRADRLEQRLNAIEQRLSALETL